MLPEPVPGLQQVLELGSEQVLAQVLKLAQRLVQRLAQRLAQQS